MATQWLRRGWLCAVGATALLLAACGGGSVDSQFTPARIVAFGDAVADLGQNGARYTINDGSVSNWTQYIANGYNRPLVASSAGGTSYAIGNARVTARPDAAGNAATPTVTEQVDAFLAGGAPLSGDLLILSAGTSDVIVQGKAVIDGAQTNQQALDAVGLAGRELAAQARRLVQAGATHVVVVGPYNIGRTVWAIQASQTPLLEALSNRFNDQFKVTAEDLGANLLYVDAALYVNLLSGSPTNYGLSNAIVQACTSVDPGPGIGTGTGQVNSNLCTTSTLLAGIDRDKYLWADRAYLTPQGHRLLGEYALNRLRERW